jgi:peroxiredoxin Q/BCP
METLKVGDKAPSFSIKNQNGKTINLADFKGKKVVLYFYPEDDTPGCTKEACNLRDNYADMRVKGYEIIGISANDEKSHSKFAEKYSLPFDLGADTDMSVINAYGVYGEKNLYGRKYMGIKRTTFIIDEKGEIERIIAKVQTDKHADQILK